MANCPFCNSVTGNQALFCSNCGQSLSNSNQYDSSKKNASINESVIAPNLAVKMAIKNTIFVGHPVTANSLDALLSKHGVTALHMIFDSDHESLPIKVKKALNAPEYKATQYICIIGNWEDVPPFYLPNPLESDDGDELCQSDAPYGCLGEFSENDIFSIIPSIQVGRIPSRDLRIIERALFITPEIPDPQQSLLFGVSDSCWTQATHAIVDNFKGVPPQVLDYCEPPLKRIPEAAVVVSPDWDESNLKRVLGKGLIEPNKLLLFNVHGSADDPGWVCQNGPGNYIEIFNPGTISDFNDSVLVTEACYGGALGYDEPSIVEKFFANRGLAFLGSSNIAYGSCDESLLGADLIALNFLQGLAKGMSYGEALNFAKMETMTADPYSEDVARKTVMSFNLFGAPWHRVNNIVSKNPSSLNLDSTNTGNKESILGQIRSRNIGFRRSHAEYSILEDLRERYRLRIHPTLVQFLVDQDQTLEKIREFADASKIEKYINEWTKAGNHFTLKSIKSNFETSYRLFSKPKGIAKFQNITIVLIDSQGKIKNTMSSKGIL